MNELRQKVALVTGSSRGIGAAIARLFARHGAKVALHGRDTTALSAVLASIQGDGGTAIQTCAELTRFDEIEALRRQVEQALGPIDVLVANAGGNHTEPRLPLESLSEEGFRASVDNNLLATFLTVKSVLPSMKERRTGSIITMSSAASRRPTPASPMPYAAAKAGVELLTQHLAAEVGPFGVRVNCIAPESILTERSRRQIPAEQQQRMVEAHPLKRLGTPEDVAEAALFLAAESAGWISGVVLDIAGGAVLYR